MGIDDEVADELAQAPARQRHDDAWRHRGDERTDPQQQAVGPPEKAGRGRGRDRRQLAGRHVRVLGPRDPVDEADREVEARRVPDERGELPADRQLGLGLFELRGRHPSLGERDGVVDQRGEIVGPRRGDLDAALQPSGDLIKSW